MKRYIYNSDIGTFEIRQMSHLLYQLWIEEELLGEVGRRVDGVPTRHAPRHRVCRGGAAT